MWPVITRNEEGKEKVYDLPSCLLKDRIVLIFEQINPETAASVISQLLFLEAEDPDAKITIYINSPGGSITDGLAIYDTLNKVRCPIETVCVGMAASMGAFLLSSGTRGMRYAMPNSCIMVHQPLGGASGQATEIDIAARRILSLREKLYTILAGNSDVNYEAISKACERDNYLEPEEALKLGLIDNIINTQPKGYKG